MSKKLNENEHNIPLYTHNLGRETGLQLVQVKELTTT